MLNAGATPASTDPAVAAAFPTHGEQFGQGVLHLATPTDIAGPDVELGDYLPYDAQAMVGTTSGKFTPPASTTISACAARAALADMVGVDPGSDRQSRGFDHVPKG